MQEEEKENKNGKTQWIEDYKLLDWGPRGLFPEYLEMSEFNFHYNFKHYILNSANIVKKYK